MAKTFPAYTDHSWGRPGAQAIKDSGYLGVMRYTGDPANGKNLGRAEMDEYHRLGLLVGHIWETTANRVLSGFPGGAEDGPKANWWLDQLGVPDDVTIVGTCVDFAASPEQIRGPIRDYAIGFSRNSKRRQIPYGNDVALNILCSETDLFPCGWQTVAWSGGRLSRYACMLQQAGYVLNNTSDHNSIINLADAQSLGWNPNNQAVVHPPTKPPEDEEMLTIWWCAPNDSWLENVAAPFLRTQGETIDTTKEQGFIVEGRQCRYIGVHAYPGHEGWDDRTTAQRAVLAYMGFPNGEREAHGIKSDLWAGVTLNGSTDPQTHAPANVTIDKTDMGAVIDEIVQRTAKATVAEIAS
jgi:hypothetical protein